MPLGYRMKAADGELGNRCSGLVLMAIVNLISMGTVKKSRDGTLTFGIQALKMLCEMDSIRERYGRPREVTDSGTIVTGRMLVRCSAICCRKTNVIQSAVTWL